MKNFDFKKNIYLAFFISFLLFLLYVSYNIESVEVDLGFAKTLYAATAQSSTSTKQSSTKEENNKENSEISDEMVDLLAKVINAEARGEPYLRASGGRSCYNE